MSIMTFAGLISTPGTKKIFLVEIQPSQKITGWVLYSGSIYRYEVGTIHVQSITEDGVTLTEKTSIAAIAAGSWYYDGTYIYLQSTSGTPYQNIIVAKYKLYYGTEAKIFNDYYYEPFVAGIPKIVQDKPELYWGISIISNGTVKLYNDRGHFDNIFESYAWENAEIVVLIGGEDLPYTEYESQFNGKIVKKSMTTGGIVLDFEDRKKEIENSLPLNRFTKAVYPNLDSEDVGKPIPYLWGTCYRVPVVCTNRAEITSTYNFKLCDTSTHSINAISTVYVEDKEVAATSTNMTAATFNLPSTIYTSGDAVSADVIGYMSGTVISNPIDIQQEITELLGIVDGDWDTTARAAARAEAENNFADIGLFVGEYQSGLDLSADIMKSIMGNFYTNNEGEFSGSVWNVDMPADPTLISDIDIKDFKMWAVTDEIRKTVRCGWRKNWSKGTYSYDQNTTSQTEYVYDIKKTRTIPTLLSSQAGVNLFLSHMELLYRNATIMMSFKTKLALADKNIGDRFQLSFRRRRADSDYDWLSAKNVEIQKIEKDFDKSEYKVTVDDLKSVGDRVGHWTDETFTFPDSVGGGTATAWDDSWSDDKKVYAKSAWGFWVDDDGFIDTSDVSTLGYSLWW